jgi:hypothetical protein
MKWPQGQSGAMDGEHQHGVSATQGTGAGDMADAGLLGVMAGWVELG